jgi:hypothetical protein
MRNLLVLLSTTLLLTACSTTSTLRLCNGRLESINPPPTIPQSSQAPQRGKGP